MNFASGGQKPVFLTSENNKMRAFVAYAALVKAFDTDCSVPEENEDFLWCDAGAKNTLYECLKGTGYLFTL